MSNDVRTLKKKLIEKLKSKSLDYESIISLSEKIVASDDQSLRFSVDAKHIHRLGFELVGKQETAVSELIKNAYDADATLVTVDFYGHDKPGGRLVISDNGHGMTLAVIKTAWMCLSTDDKEQNPLSPVLGRSRAGRKGIGRFAVQRLGRRLTLETGVKGKTEGTRVAFDWDEMYKHGVTLTRVANKLEAYKKDRGSSGTTLIIDDLRDAWKPSRIDRVWASVLLLQPPFKARKQWRTKAKGRTYEPDPGFEVVINKEGRVEAAKKLSIEETFLKNRVALIKGSVDEKGYGHLSVSAPGLGLKDKAKTEKTFSLTGPVEFEVSYFIYDSDLISGVSLKDAREMGDKYGGVRVYRDGFRVLPYGEQNDDWLRLGRDSARRALLVPANNNNFFGQVEISSIESPLFEETSSREGLIENEAYEELRELVRLSLEWAAKRVAWARGRKQTSSQKGFSSTARAPRKPSEITLQLIEDLEKTAGDAFSPEARKQLEKASEEQRRYEDEVEKREQERTKYEEMLRILASLGISIAVFAHEIRGALTRVAAAIKRLREDAHAGKVNEGTSIREAETVTSRLFDLGAYVVGLIDRSKARNKKEIALYAAIKTFVQQFSDYLDARGISFSFDVQPQHLRTRPMHPSEIDSVLFNFLTNSIKAMERTNAAERQIKITARSQGGNAVISFQDSGGGVPDAIKDKIFDAFFTTSEYAEDTIAGPGSGLGLKIVSDIAHANGGSVVLSEPDSGYSCNFEFSVPQSVNQTS